MNRLYTLFIILIISFACGGNYTPKPAGYFRVDLPSHEYSLYSGNCPFDFYYPTFAAVNEDKGPNSEPCWFNIELKGHKAQIHLTYKPVKGNLTELTEDTRNLAYKHTIKADAINESLYSSPESKVYGILYEIKGNAASSLQFFVTDSTSHFLRGALYFNVKPNKDSLAPVIAHFKQDISYMIETFAWK
jgi:gliding motility-associated lipoprotein GldD